MSALPGPQLRADHGNEEELLKGYLHVMRKEGCSVPDWDQAWILYRRALLVFYRGAELVE